MLTIHKLRLDAIEAFKCRLDETGITDLDSVTDLIHSVTDNIIPVYTREILEVSLSNLNFACSNSDLGPAYGNDIPINHIISNIYEYLSIELQEWYDENI